MDSRRRRLQEGSNTEVPPSPGQRPKVFTQSIGEEQGSRDVALKKVTAPACVAAVGQDKAWQIFTPTSTPPPNRVWPAAEMATEPHPTSPLANHHAALAAMTTRQHQSHDPRLGAATTTARGRRPDIQPPRTSKPIKRK